MSTPALNELPKVAVDIKSQIEGFDTNNMKHAVTQEKSVLPTAEGSYYKICVLLFLS